MTSPHSNVSAAQLDAAYRATAYIAYLPEGPLVLRIGEHSPWLDRLLMETGCTAWAFISACNPYSHQLTPEENTTRHAQLAAATDVLGLRRIEGLGQPDLPGWLPEASLLILGLERDEALALAARFGQNAIVRGSLGEPPKLEYADTI